MDIRTNIGFIGVNLILLLVRCQVDAHTSCKKDWSEYDNYCYYLNTGSYTWEDARTWCRNAVNGGDLVSILSSGENTHVDNMISSSIHIGFNDLSLEGDWQWSDGRSVTYTNWNGNEPSGNSGLGNCAGMYTSGTWDDYACSGSRPFVCKVAKEWTSVQTGCQCYFDTTRYDCACCRDGGCNCGISYPHQCVECGDANACGQDYSGPFDQWKVVFKAVSSLGSLNVYNLWTGSSTYNDGDTYAPYISYTSDHYKSSEANSWDTSSIGQVKLAFFDGGVEMVGVVFDVSGTSRTSWFSSSYLTYAPYTDIYTAGYNYFSMSGHDNGNILRHFFLSSYYSGCNGDAGWIVVSDPPHGGGCDWDNAVTRPAFLYSTATTRQAFASGDYHYHNIHHYSTNAYVVVIFVVVVAVLVTISIRLMHETFT
ncbi:uncharacterized protein [Ptychodera flava]|uniref:uncharacterized protein n=1 Tax=Ptychodera flava TaxID=63121 RepID=UPI00396A6A6B